MIINHKRRTPEKRNRINDPRYNTRKWRATRLRVLTRDGYLCQCEDCKKLPVPLLAPIKGGVADHTIPVTRGGDFWDEQYIQAMNKSCHQRKSQSEVRR